VFDVWSRKEKMAIANSPYKWRLLILHRERSSESKIIAEQTFSFKKNQDRKKVGRNGFLDITFDS